MAGKTPEDPPQELRGWWDYLRQGLAKAHRRRPVSFYMLLAMPVVLLLGAPLFEPKEAPGRFACMLAALFVFFGVVIYQAFRDLFHIARGRLHEHRDNFQRTLGDPEFTKELGSRVKKAPRE